VGLLDLSRASLDLEEPCTQHSLALLSAAAGLQPLQQAAQGLIYVCGLIEQALLLADHVVEQAPLKAPSPGLERLDLLFQNVSTGSPIRTGSTICTCCLAGSSRWTRC